jgi:hypothetical protein
MERTGWKAALALGAAGALLASQPAQAAMGCWNQEPAAAAKVRDFQSRLMVAALRCRAMGLDVLAAYNEFIRQNRSALQAENNLIHAQFDTGYGAESETYYDRFTTSLANRYGGDATSEQICNDTAWAAQEGAAAAGDVSKLIALADRFGSLPELPGGECPPGALPIASVPIPASRIESPAPAAAKWRTAAPATFAAVMDRALSDVSDAPAESR